MAKIPCVYSNNKILIGNWVEDRHWYTREDGDNLTTYLTHYTPKPLCKGYSDVVWDMKLDAERNNIVSQVGRHDHPSYFENFSSLYDLSYKHFPICFPNGVRRKWRFMLNKHEPSDEYLNTYGNLTEYGLFGYMKTKWECEVEDPRRTNITQYQDTYMKPNVENYKFRHFPKPNWCTPKSDYTNSREGQCNIITWECK